MKGAINCIKILCSAYFLNSFALVCGQIYENGPPNLHVLNFEILRNWVDTSGYADNPSTNTNWLIAFVHGPCSDCVYESLQIIDLAQYILESGLDLQMGVFLCDKENDEDIVEAAEAGTASASESEVMMCNESETVWAWLPKAIPGSQPQKEVSSKEVSSPSQYTSSTKAGLPMLKVVVEINSLLNEAEPDGFANILSVLKKLGAGKDPGLVPNTFAGGGSELDRNSPDSQGRLLRCRRLLRPLSQPHRLDPRLTADHLVAAANHSLIVEIPRMFDIYDAASKNSGHLVRILLAYLRLLSEAARPLDNLASLHYRRLHETISMIKKEDISAFLRKSEEKFDDAHLEEAEKKKRIQFGYFGGRGWMERPTKWPQCNFEGTGSDGGYVCALWQLFHFLTAECVRKNCSALPIIINYVQYFYRSTKQTQFMRLVHLKYPEKSYNRIDEMLWLWEAHNSISDSIYTRRIFAENPECFFDSTKNEYSAIYPSEFECPKCTSKKLSTDQRKEAIAEYLLYNVYHSGLRKKYIEF